MNATTDRVFDADQHFYEPLDAFTRHLPKGWGPRTVQVAEIDRRTRYIVGGQVNHTVTNPTFDPIVKPGAMVDFFRGNPDGLTLAECLAHREPIPSCYRNPDSRIATMDDQDVQYTWMLPTLGMAFEEGLQFDPEAAAVAFEAYNRWLLDDWGFNHRDRIFSAPYLAMGDRDRAVAEVDWALDHGARLFVVRPTGVYTADGWRSPGDPWFDPIWARIAEAGVPVVPHVAEVGGHGLERFLRNRVVGIIGTESTPLQVIVGHERPIANYLGALIADRLFERFPKLHVASVENGAEFLPLLLAGLERVRFQRPGYFAQDPVDAFREHVWVAPFWEDNLGEAIRLIGASQVLFGSDWPHPEGMAQPRDFEKFVDELGDPAARRLIMFENAARLTGVAV
jgi:predicted TIM-barrel fold metal-dependent hydrolase